MTDANTVLLERLPTITGAELSRLTAERVMGWTKRVYLDGDCWFGTNGYPCRGITLWRPHADPADWARVLQCFSSYEIKGSFGDGLSHYAAVWKGVVFGEGIGSTPGEAACRAALAAVLRAGPER